MCVISHSLKRGDWILAERDGLVFGDPAWRKVPGYTRCYLRGFEDALFSFHNEHDLVWLMVDPDTGKRTENPGRYVADMKGDHYWKEHYERGELCQY